MQSVVGWSAMFTLCPTLAPSSISAQVQVVARACTKDGNQYSCDKANFEKILHVARTVSVRTPRLHCPASDRRPPLCVGQMNPIPIYISSFANRCIDLDRTPLYPTLNSPNPRRMC